MTSTDDRSLEQIKEELAAEQRRTEESQKKIREGLPHLFAFKWYPWAREFFEGKHKVMLLTAGNQASKSSSQIRKCIEWATNKELWKELWPSATIHPNLFWYMYPSQKVVDAEFLTKWMQFLPRNSFKDSKLFGWRPIKEGSHVIGIKFNSGVIVLFKTYSQKVSDLQSSSVYVAFVDEELPMHIYDELMFRITATKGYFNMVFTATLGQDFWRRAIEPTEEDIETLPMAWKRQVSLYECMHYEDGTNSHWTIDEVKAIADKCSSHEEYLRRVLGRFITPSSGRKYPTFDAKRHYIARHRIPNDWEVYSGVDLGGGGDGHPAAIAFVAVAPDYSEGRIFAGWRGDGIGHTVAADVMDKYRELKFSLGIKPTREFYDQASRDFKTIAERMHENFEMADKSHERGDEIINMLFKLDILKIFNDDEHLLKFGQEIVTIKNNLKKSSRKDDFVDAVRYAITQIPWNFDRFKDRHKATPAPIKEETSNERSLRERKERAEQFRNKEAYSRETEEEFRELNDLYEGK